MKKIKLLYILIRILFYLEETGVLFGSDFIAEPEPEQEVGLLFEREKRKSCFR